MKKKNVLSLHEETEKEAAKIEKEILKDSKLEEIKVSDEMEKRLAEQIQAYEKTQSQKKVHRHSPLFRRRVMVAAAVLMIAAVATSVTAVGSKSYLKEIIEKFTGETGQASVIARLSSILRSMWRIWIRRQVRVRMRHRCIGR